jgi:hypothetical protein
MTHQIPNRPPRRRSRHAAAARPSTQLRQRARRNVRLLVAAVSAAAGICLIVGSVALVAEITELPAARQHATAAHQRAASAVEAGKTPQAAGRGHPSRSAAPPPVRVRGHSRRPRRPPLSPSRLRLEAAGGGQQLVEDRIPGAAPLELKEAVGSGDQQEAVPELRGSLAARNRG